jgi:paraquat-inducible protein A
MRPMTASLVACHDCDLLHRKEPAPEHGAALCARCGAVLYRSPRAFAERSLALSLASLALLVMSTTLPFLTFRMAGLVEENHLASGVEELRRQGLWPLALLVLFATVLAPATRLLLVAWVCAGLLRGRRSRGLRRALLVAERLKPWAMLEVFLLGALVAIIKLGQIAEVSLDPAIYAFGALIVVMSAANAGFDAHAAWDALE